MNYNHQVTVLGHRPDSLNPEECYYTLDVNAEICEPEMIDSGSYYQPAEYSGGSKVDDIYYKGINVTAFVLNLIEEDKIIEAITHGGCELDSARLSDYWENK